VPWGEVKGEGVIKEKKMRRDEKRRGRQEINQEKRSYCEWVKRQ
jgi:hypothetical protein